MEHIFNGFIPQKNDMVLGHEFMGIVEETGRGVRKLQKGDRVVALAEAPHAYQIVRDKEDNCVKVVLKP